jgi:hypothetical protein
VLARIDELTIAVRATSPFGGNVQPYPGDGRIDLANVTSIQLA